MTKPAQLDRGRKETTVKNRKKAERIFFQSEKDMPIAPMSVGSQMHNKTGVWRNMRPVINLAECIQCGICWKFCPDACIYVENEWPVIDYEYCKGCGICGEECPTKCIANVEEKR
jgi:2-oxoisovalerate ferredoxin oxidoreductase delta subunit